MGGGHLRSTGNSHLPLGFSNKTDSITHNVHELQGQRGTPIFHWATVSTENCKVNGKLLYSLSFSNKTDSITHNIHEL